MTEVESPPDAAARDSAVERGVGALMALRGDMTRKDARRIVMTVLDVSGAVWPGTEFFGAAEASEELGVLGPNLRKEAELPAEFGRVRSGPFWVARDIRAVAAKRRRGD